MHSSSFSSVIRPLRTGLVIGAITLAGLGVACSDSDGDATAEVTTTAEATATVEATSTAEATATADATQTVPGADDESVAAYSSLVEDVTTAFPDVTLIEDTGAFEVRDLVGEGRRVLIFGTAAELPNFVEIQQTLRGILADDGWTEDFQYAADGPTGTLSVWEKGDDTAVLAGGVSPQDPSVCPADQIIGECLDGLDPAEINVQGSISVAYR